MAGIKCAKTTFCVLCVAFMCVGIGLSSIALWTLFDEDSRLQTLYPSLISDIEPVLWIIAVIGILIAVISLCGICGSLRESTCVLTAYFIVVLVTLISIISCIIAAIVIFQEDSMIASRILYQRMNESYGSDDAFTGVVDQMQKDLACCGAFNYSDFLSTPWYAMYQSEEADREKVPSSCCNVPPAQDEATSSKIDECKRLVNTNLVHSTTCPAALNSWLNLHRGWLIAIAVIVALLNTALLALSCYIRTRVHGGYSQRGRYV